MEPDDTTLRCRYGIHANDPHHQACEYTIIIADEVMIFFILVNEGNDAIATDINDGGIMFSIFVLANVRFRWD